MSSEWACVNGVWEGPDGKPVKTAPLQIHPRGNQCIPWEVASEGYREYVACYGQGQTLERLCERGGFAATELCILLYDRIKRLEGERR